MEEDDILYQSIIADPEQVSSDVDVSGLRTETDTNPDLLGAVSEFPGLKFDSTSYDQYADLYDLYSRGLPMVDTGTTATDTITTPVVETGGEGGGGESQVTGDLTTTPINTDTSMIGGDLDQGGVGDGITNYEYTPEETAEQQQAIDQSIQDLGSLYNPMTEVPTDPAIADAALSSSFYVPNQTGAEIEQPGVLDNISTAARNAFETVKSGASTAVDFISSYGYPAYQALSGNLVAAGASLLNPLTLGLGFAGKIFESVGDTASKQEYDSYSQEQQSQIDQAYGPSGVMEGYNAVSGFGQGVQATVQSRLDERRSNGIPDTSATSQELIGLQNNLGITDFTQLTQEQVSEMDDKEDDVGREINFETGEITGSPTGDVNIYDEFAPAPAPAPDYSSYMDYYSGNGDSDSGGGGEGSPGSSGPGGSDEMGSFAYGGAVKTIGLNDILKRKKYGKR